MSDFTAIASALVAQTKTPAQRRTNYTALHEGIGTLAAAGWNARAIAAEIKKLPEWEEHSPTAIYTAVARYIRTHRFPKC